MLLNEMLEYVVKDAMEYFDSGSSDYVEYNIDLLSLNEKIIKNISSNLNYKTKIDISIQCIEDLCNEFDEDIDESVIGYLHFVSDSLISDTFEKSPLDKKLRNLYLLYDIRNNSEFKNMLIAKSKCL